MVYYNDKVILFSIDMKAHLSKDEFKYVAVTVMVLEVAAFLIFVFAMLFAILSQLIRDFQISPEAFIFIGFGGIFISLMMMAAAEILQLVMRIEHNTRKENTLLMEQTQVQRAEVKATRSLAAALKKPTKRKTTKKRKPATRKKATVKKVAVKKVKPRKKKK